MIDALTPVQGKDLPVQNSIAPKAGNVINIQLGSLDFAPDFGVDLAYFITDDFQFQAASFQAYLVQRLTQHKVNVAKVINVIQGFMQNNTFTVGEQSDSVGGIQT